MNTEREWLMHLLHEGLLARDPNPGRDQVSHYQHALLCAENARLDGADSQGIAVALLHDAARPLSDERHGQVIAEILQPHIAAEWYEALRRHGEFQADILHGTDHTWSLYDGRHWYNYAVRLAKWDAAAFDPTQVVRPFAEYWAHVDTVMGWDQHPAATARLT